MEPSPVTPWFAWSCQELRSACGRLGLVAPAFRAPPAVPGADRTLRRVPEGGVWLAVRIRERPWEEIRRDLVEGILAANEVDAATAARLRPQLEEVVPCPEHRSAA